MAVGTKEDPSFGGTARVRGEEVMGSDYAGLANLSSKNWRYLEHSTRSIPAIILAISGSTVRLS